jgi:hypothetical protein
MAGGHWPLRHGLRRVAGQRNSFELAAVIQRVHGGGSRRWVREAGLSDPIRQQNERGDSLSIGTVTAVKKANSADLGQAEPMLSDVAKANLRELANLPQA